MVVLIPSEQVETEGQCNKCRPKIRYIYREIPKTRKDLFLVFWREGYNNTRDNPQRNAHKRNIQRIDASSILYFPVHSLERR